MKSKLFCTLLAAGLMISTTVPAFAMFPAQPFSDVEEDDWYHDAVTFVYQKGIASGTATGEGKALFQPESSVSRAMFVTMLGRVAEKMGIEMTDAENFSDVSDDDYFRSYVSWAAAEGITSGYSPSVFAPDDTVTREQAAAMAAAFAGAVIRPLPDADQAAGFVDSADISGWASDAVERCAAAGILKGYGDGTFRPQAEMSRAEAALMIGNLCTACGIELSDNDMNAVAAASVPAAERTEPSEQEQTDDRAVKMKDAEIDWVPDTPCVFPVSGEGE